MRSEGKNRQSRVPHRGIALMAVVVTLVILALIMSAIAWQMVTGSRVLLHRQYELQAGWLARAGIEHATAQLLQRPDEYRGELLEPIERSSVLIAVSEEPVSGTYRVRSEARYPTDLVAIVSRTQIRLLKRVTDGETVRLECIASNDEM